MKEYTIKPVASANEDNILEKRGGYPCPDCGGAVHITMHQLLEGKCVFCPECGLRIDFSARRAKDKCK